MARRFGLASPTRSRGLTLDCWVLIQPGTDGATLCFTRLIDEGFEFDTPDLKEAVARVTVRWPLRLGPT